MAHRCVEFIIAEWDDDDELVSTAADCRYIMLGKRAACRTASRSFVGWAVSVLY